MRARSAYMKPPWQFQLRDVDLPDALPPGYALLRIEACGVCGSDVIWAENGFAGASDWTPFGHEFAGFVEDVNDATGRLKKGDRVVFLSGVFCGQCDRCLDGRADLCKKGPGGWDAKAMGFSDHKVAPVTSLVPYDGLDPDVASLVEPAGVGFDLVKTADIQMGDTVCVVGPGPIALTALSLAVHRGASEIVCIGLRRDTSRLALAEELGARAIANDGPLDQLTELHGRFDHVLMTAPTAFIPQALPFLAFGGYMTYIGLAHGDGTISFDAEDFHFRKLQLRASFASPAMYFPAVIRLLKAGVIPGKRLITHRFTLDDIGKAVRAAYDDKENTIKVVVIP